MSKQCKAFIYTKYTDQGNIHERMAFGIARLPGESKSCLYLVRGSELKSVAFFETGEDAELFREIFHQWEVQPHTVTGD